MVSRIETKVGIRAYWAIHLNLCSRGPLAFGKTSDRRAQAGCRQGGRNSLI